MNDYKELIEALKCCFTDQKGCYKNCFACPYECFDNDCEDISLNALNAIERLVRERDAAVEDLSLNGRYCVTCKHFSVFCKRNNKCLSDENEHWEWRGVQE